MLHNKYAFDIIKKIGYYRDKLKTKTKIVKNSTYEN